MTLAERAAPWPSGAGEMNRRVREADWGATSLGTSQEWQQGLRAVVELMLASPLVSSVAIGPERVLLYNDAAARLYGERHPGALGRPLAESWPQGYPTVAPLYARAFDGEPIHLPAQPLDLSPGSGEVFEVVLAPVRDAGGAVVAVLMTGFEVGPRVRAEAALCGSEARYRAFVTASADVVYRMSADWSELRELDGRGVLAGTAEPSRSWMARYIDPEDRHEVQAAIDRATRTRSIFELEHRVRHADGTLGWVQSRAVPIVDDEGGIAEWLGTARDVTERHEAEVRIRASEERFRAIVESARDYAIFTTDAEGLIETWPPGAEAVFGWTAEEAVGRPVAMTFTPEDVAAGQPEAEMAGARDEGQAPDVRLHACRDGSRVFIEGVMRPLRGPDGALTGFLKIGRDATERRAAEEAMREMQGRLRVLVAELQHRTRNLMGVILGVMRRTRRGSPDLDRFAADFQSRLDALARVQGLLSRLDEGHRVTFDELIRTELGAMGAVDPDGTGPQVTLDGPKGVRLRSSTVQTLALALHELATNAVKHGALGQRNGRLAVLWQRLRDGAEGPRLRVEWAESGVAMPQPGAAPRGGGYGRELIERALPYQLGAETTYEVMEGGVRCTITLPLSSTSE